MAKIAAIIGGGVIGGGWAARFVLMGWEVRVFDPDPEAGRKIGEVMDNARRSMPGLADMPLPTEGSIRICETLEDAVSGAVWVQESVPERLELKRKVYAQIQAHEAGAAIIASSTSGFKPSQLAEGAAHPEAILVAHPFNPVYLLPLVEVVPSGQTAPGFIEAACEILTGLGMYPLVLRKEIDAHVADRLMESVWREALWLVRDGIATTEEIDNAIRYGFGLRWAQMGLFETFRVAGGEAGMRHFIEQFGPCLQWPWTRLTDVPELTDDLIDSIATQSDAQADGRSVRELERIRDNNLVAILRALKWQDWGAGALLKAQDARLADEAGVVTRYDQIEDIGAPIVTLERAVPLDWTDYNGHMNEARYLQAFGDATDRFMEIVGCTPDYIATGGSYFTAETHIRHLDELHAGAHIRAETICLDGQGKKMHLFHQLFEGDRLCATGEHVLIHVSLETRRPAPPSARIERRLGTIEAAHHALPRPEGIGRYVGQPR